MCERCAELEEGVAYLKGELGLIHQQRSAFQLRHVLGLTPSEMCLAAVLYEHRYTPVAYWVLREAVKEYGVSENGDDCLRVYICRIRKKLGSGAVQNLWGFGYQMSPAGVGAYEKAMLRAA